ncbi:MAG: hypothetical protein ABI699_05320, partial [Caldimonas sp.]
MKRFSKEIVSEAYVGILGREPDPGGLAAHAAVLARSGDLASLFSEMARSDEAWSRAQGEHAESTVRQLHDALRGGGAEIGASEWVGAPGSTFELGAVAAALATGPAHWRQLARHDPGVLIDAAYQALIGRQADEGGLATYTRLLRDGGDLVALLSSIGQSAEH